MSAEWICPIYSGHKRPLHAALGIYILNDVLRIIEDYFIDELDRTCQDAVGCRHPWIVTIQTLQSHAKLSHPRLLTQDMLALVIRLCRYKEPTFSIWDFRMDADRRMGADFYDGTTGRLFVLQYVPSVREPFFYLARQSRTGCTRQQIPGTICVRKMKMKVYLTMERVSDVVQCNFGKEVAQLLCTKEPLTITAYATINSLTDRPRQYTRGPWPLELKTILFIKWLCSPSNP